MIELSDICIAFDKKPVFDHFSLSLPQGGTVCLMGESGRGKTTLLRLLAGLLRPDQGTVSGLEGKKVSMLFQEDRLLPQLSALENVALVSDQAAAQNWLKSMKIKKTAALPAELSGGMQRRVSLARAMAYGGDILLLDEPFKGLDEKLRHHVIGMIRDVFPLTVISTHDRHDAEEMGGTIIQL